MRIEGNSSYLAMNDQVRGIAGQSNDAGRTFAAVLSQTSPGASSIGGSSPGAATQTDFSCMTRKDLADWMNSKIKSGDMPLDGSEAFLGMTMKMPVNGAYAGLDEVEQVDFFQTVQGGMEWARQHHDAAAFESLQSALLTMQRDQGGSAGDAIG